MRDCGCVDTESAVRPLSVRRLLHTLQIIQAIHQDEQALQRCGVEPAMLPALVEHNPAIAIEVLPPYCLPGSAPAQLVWHPMFMPIPSLMEHIYAIAIEVWHCLQIVCL